MLQPRRVGIEKFREWAGANLRAGDAVVLETTTNVWDVYDIVSPLVSYTVVAHAGGVRQIAEARVTPALAGGARETDKKDVEQLIPPMRTMGCGKTIYTLVARTSQVAR